MNRSFFLIIIFITTFFTTYVDCSFGTSIYANNESKSIQARKHMIENVLNSPLFNFTYPSLSILLDALLTEPRGRMQGRLITVSTKVLRDSEFVKLFVHELGHFIDIYVLMPSGDIDISKDFYGISWKTSSIKKSSEGLSAFVSGYATTNQYEDFAESFVFYIFHNRAFEDRAMRNESLRKKYLFFQNNLFSNGAFTDSDYTIGKMPSYLWDTTKIPISLQKYLYSLR